MLFVGGVSPQGAMLSEAELWDSQTGTATTLSASLQTHRRRHAAALQPDGGVLVWGGTDKDGAELSDSERYDLLAQRFIPSGSLTGEPDGTAPYLSGSLPADGATDVATNARIALRFSQPLRVETVTAETVTLTGAEGVVALKIVPAEGGRLLFLAPRQQLTPATAYTLTFDGAADVNNSAPAPASITFTTAASGHHDGHIPPPAQAPPGNQTPPTDRQPPSPDERRSETRDQHTPSRPDHAMHEHEQTDNLQILDDESWLPSQSEIRGDWRSNRPPSRWQSLPALEAPAGETALAGQVLKLNGEPLAGVTLIASGKTALTDATGRFLLRSLAPGRHHLLIAGHTASRPGKPYGTFEVLADTTAGQTSALPYTIWLPVLDTRNATRLPALTIREMAATTPSIPELEVRIPAGVMLKYPVGGQMQALTITPLPSDRPPFPLPGGAEDGMLLSLQMHGAQVLKATGEASGIRIIYPNYANLPPGARGDFWNYDPTGPGWYIYGRGTASSDGRQVVPDPGVELQSMHCVSYFGPGGPGGRTPGSGADGGDPVDLSTGLFIYEKTDMVLPDTIPITLSRTYRPNDIRTRSFGIGTTNSYELNITGDAMAANLVLPDGGHARYLRTSQGTGITDAVMEHAGTPTALYKAVLAWGTSRSPAGWDVKLKNGMVVRFKMGGGATRRPSMKFKIVTAISSPSRVTAFKESPGSLRRTVARLISRMTPATASPKPETTSGARSAISTMRAGGCGRPPTRRAA